MFERRLRALWILLTAMAVALIVRLVDIQVLHADEYEALAARRMQGSLRYLGAPRGSVFDRHGRVLVADVPASDISVHYVVLTGRSAPYLRAVARAMRLRGDVPADMSLDDIVVELHLRLSEMWQRLSELTGRPIANLLERADEIRARIERIKASVARRSGREQPVVEEGWWHPLIEGVDNEFALVAREELERYPWLRVTPSARREARDADAFVHILGRLGGASPQRIDRDPLRDDELRRLRPGDDCGVSGVERLAEPILRGIRGYIREDFDRTEVERREPVPGCDVSLTIDAELQRRTLAILAQAVRASEHPAGGAAVVIDVATREVLALVSYPVYSYERYSEEYDRLRRDKLRLPTLARAVQALYPPGSTCKVITLYGALADGLLSADTSIACEGYFRPDQPSSFRCWIYNQYGAVHGPQAATDAIRNSCNIYFYSAGDRLGPERLCEWFARFGLGCRQGTGLSEEQAGIVPSAAWLAEHRRRAPRRSDAWNFSIGQGEVSATPLQAANVAATVASGRWAPVHLVRAEAGDWLDGEARSPVKLDEGFLRTLRSGMWRVVNEGGGTAERARLNHADYVMCGKTGSAQTSRRALLRKYACEWSDGRRETVVAPEKQDARLRFVGDEPDVVRYAGIHELYPPPDPAGKLPCHAWFIGFTQSRDTPRGEHPRGKVYAISVIVEFGGSGGKVAGPVARQIAELLLGGVE